MLIPHRRYGMELLDEPGVDPAVRLRSLRDVERSNRLFGGRRAVAREVELVLDAPQMAGSAGTAAAPIRLLDVGSGTGDMAAAMTGVARRHGIRMITIAVDLAPELAHASAARADHAACADAFHLPFADDSMDVVTCSQLLHHFPERACIGLLRELHRVSRRSVIVGDLRRSWLAAAGFWLASFPLGFHPVTRHDGTLSVLRGFTGPELAGLVRDAVGTAPAVRRHAGWRLTASWAAGGQP